MNAPQSSTRLIAIMFAVTGCLLALGTLMFAFFNPTAVSTVVALTSVLTCIVVKGCFAIYNRSKPEEVKDDAS